MTHSLITMLREKLGPLETFSSSAGTLVEFDAYQKREAMLLKVVEKLVEQRQNLLGLFSLLPRSIAEQQKYDQSIIDLINSEGEAK